jgi:hypothetical protein
MSDNFINRLDPASLADVKNTDYTVFDIGDPIMGTFNTKKVTLDTLANKLSSIVSDGIQSKLNILQNSINTANANVQNKLDKTGLTFGSNEKISGPLVINAKLSALSNSDFYGTLNLNNNGITNLIDPTLSGDAANKNYVDSTLNTKSSYYIPLSGGTMTNTTPLILNVHPTNISNVLQATTRKYVDDGVASCVSISGGQMARGYITVAAGYENPSTTKDLVTQQYVDNKITSSLNSTTNFVHISGNDWMTGPLYLNGDPDNFSDGKRATTKKYVDDKISTNINNLPSKFIPLSGGTMTNTTPLLLNIHPTNGSNDLQATTKKYVDNVSNSLSAYLPLSGGTMTGTLILSGDPDSSSDKYRAATKNYVDTLGKGLSSYLPLSGGTMDGPLIIKSYSEKYQFKQIGGNVTLSIKTANTFTISMTSNISGFTFTDEPLDSYTVSLFITQKGTLVSPFSADWKINGNVVKWASSKAPVITKVTDKVDIFCFTKISSIWYGFIGGQNY